ncbi:MAG TPA: GNAT family N-acetyltransferase [Microlunatus sp.]
MPDLVLPDVRFHRSFLEATREEPDAASYLFHGDEETLADLTVFAGYVAMLRADEREESPRPDHHVPGTNLWWAEGDHFIGRLAIRHRLNDRLRTGGGHIGYWIRPSERRKGHAAAALRTALPYAARLGIDPALVSCDADNVGSRKIIEATGGVFERQVGELRLYWLPTS